MRLSNKEGLSSEVLSRSNNSSSPSSSSGSGSVRMGLNGYNAVPTDRPSWEEEDALERKNATEGINTK